MNKNSYVTHMEEVAVEVAKRLADRMRVIEEALMPDGRPLFAEEKSDVKLCAEYLMRDGNPAAQWEYVNSLVQQASASLAAYNVDPASVHVWDVAFNYAVIESAKLRTKMAENPNLFAEAFMEANRLMQQQAMMMPPIPLG